ncbi:MAG: hypothetical protein FWF90_11520 [Promicromonosporaceae bacterium]|nr:hypothetical protein [Promicromonosporaceae bacterium]
MTEPQTNPVTPLTARRPTTPTVVGITAAVHDRAAETARTLRATQVAALATPDGAVDVPVLALPLLREAPASGLDPDGKPLHAIVVEHDGGREILTDVQRWTFGEHGELNIYGSIAGDRIAKVASFAPYTVKFVQRLDRGEVR